MILGTRFGGVGQVAMGIDVGAAAGIIFDSRLVTMGAAWVAYVDCTIFDLCWVLASNDTGLLVKIGETIMSSSIFD